jgi:hypothetical protein
MVYDTRDYWAFGIRSSSGILRNTTFRKLDLFPCSGEGVGDTYSVGSVRELTPITGPPDPVSETLCSLVFFKTPNNGQSPKT